MLFPWRGLTVIYAIITCCHALSNHTDNSTTSSSSDLSLSRSTTLSVTASDTNIKPASETSLTSIGLGSFILHGLGVTLSAASSLSASSTSSTASKASSTLPSDVIIPGTTLSSASMPNQTLTDALACNSASISWRLAHATESITTESTSSWTTTYSSETYITPNGPVFTLCDHYPRMNVKPSVLVSTSIAVLTTVMAKTLPATCTSDCPKCSIGSGDCSKLWSSWTSNTALTLSTASSPACPAPTTSSYVCPDWMPGPPDCYFKAGPVRLVYFPPEIKGNRLCGNYTTISPPSNITSPVTVETFGTTFTSGTAYISFESLGAVDTCGIALGTPMTNLYMPLPSSEVSSMCGANGGVFITGPTSTAVNYADLQTPIASDVYKCQPKCIWGGEMWSAQCPTIFDDYAPALAYPTQVKQLQPEWNKCWFKADEYFRYQYGQEFYLFDPPLALTRTNSEAGITMPATSTPTSSLKQPPYAASSASAEAGVTIPQPTKISSQVIDTSRTDPPSQSSAAVQPDPAKTNPGGSPTDPPTEASTAATPSLANALSVLANALSSALSGNYQSAQESQPNDPNAVASTPDSQINTSPDGLIIGDSLTVPVSQGEGTSIHLSGSDPVAVTREGSNYIVAGQTLSPGQAATIQGQTVSALPVNERPTGTTADPVPTLAISRSGSEYIVDGTALTPGQVTTIGDQVMSVDSSDNALMIGNSRVSLDPGSATKMAAGAMIAAPLPISRSGSLYIVDGRTLSPGDSIVINGQTISEDSAGQHVFVGTQQVSLSNGAATSVMRALALPTALTISRSGSEMIVDGHTLLPGAVSIIDGQTISALQNGDLIMGSRTVSLADGETTTLTSPDSDTTELAISHSGSAFVLDGTTLTAGQVATIDGQVVSVLSNGDGVALGSGTLSMSGGKATTILLSDSLSPEAVLTVGSSTLTVYTMPGKPNQVVIDGTTLSVGGSAMIIDRETLSLGSSGLVEIYDGHTSTLVLTGSSTTTSQPPTTAASTAAQPSSTASMGHRLHTGWTFLTLLIFLLAVLHSS